jgi:hypothetical protein
MGYEISTHPCPSNMDEVLLCKSYIGARLV